MPAPLSKKKREQTLAQNGLNMKTQEGSPMLATQASHTDADNTKALKFQHTDANSLPYLCKCFF
jgi:hypothetical protein